MLMKKMNLNYFRIFTLIILMTATAQSGSVESHPQPLSVHISTEKNTLRGAWYSLDPYEYLKTEGEIKILTGLDIELQRAIASDSGQIITFTNTTWKQQLLDIEQGTQDIASGATYTDERAVFAYYSTPYRFEENSLFILRTNADKYHFKDIPDFLFFMKKNKFRLGVVDGYVYADPKINQYINDPQNADLIVKVEGDNESLKNLLDNAIDGFLADRIVGATVIWRANKGSLVTEYRLGIKTPIHLIFSKKSVALSKVEKINQEISKFKETAKYDKIVSWYLYPVLLLQTADTDWFRIVEIIGTIAFAISGLIIAYRDNSTLFGAFIFALLPSMGGGLMRDVIIGRNPVGALLSPLYLLLIIGTVITGFIIIKLNDYLMKKFPKSVEATILKLDPNLAGQLLTVFDALGLAAFTVSGVIVSLVAKVDPLWLWGPFFAFLTGAGGGILRDMLSKTHYITVLEGGIYGEIAIFWGLFLSIVLMMTTHNIQPELIRYTVIITIVGALMTRILVYYFKIPNIRFGGTSVAATPPPPPE